MELVSVPLSCFENHLASAKEDHFLQSIWVDYNNFFSLLLRVIYGIGSASFWFAVIYRNQNIAVVHHVAITGMITPSLVRIAYLDDTI